MKPRTPTRLLALAVALAMPALIVTATAFAAPQDETTRQLDRQDSATATDPTMPPPQEGATEPPLNPEVDAMTQPPSEPTRGDEQTMQRDRWQTLDTDGDGRISEAEGAVDSDFSANFEMMDADADGYVGEDEYAQPPASGATGDDDAEASGSATDGDPVTGARDDAWSANEAEEEEEENGERDER